MDKIQIEITYGLPDKQHIETLEVTNGTTVKEALCKITELKKIFPDMLIDEKQIGIFGKHTTLEYQLYDKDRIEIYRPLLIDPKEARRARAKKQKKSTETEDNG